MSIIKGFLKVIIVLVAVCSGYLLFSVYRIDVSSTITNNFTNTQVFAEYLQADTQYLLEYVSLQKAFTKDGVIDIDKIIAYSVELYTDNDGIDQYAWKLSYIIEKAKKYGIDIENILNDSESNTENIGKELTYADKEGDNTYTFYSKIYDILPEHTQKEIDFIKEVCEKLVRYNLLKKHFLDTNIVYHIDIINDNVIDTFTNSNNDSQLSFANVFLDLSINNSDISYETTIKSFDVKNIYDEIKLMRFGDGMGRFISLNVKFINGFAMNDWYKPLFVDYVTNTSILLLLFAVSSFLILVFILGFIIKKLIFRSSKKEITPNNTTQEMSSKSQLDAALVDDIKASITNVVKHSKTIKEKLKSDTINNESVDDYSNVVIKEMKQIYDLFKSMITQ